MTLTPAAASSSGGQWTDTMRIEEQKRLARGIADLLARLEPDESPILRLQLAHWLARRIMTHRTAAHDVGQNLEVRVLEADSSIPDYQI